MPIEARLTEAAALLARAWQERSTLPGLPAELVPRTRDEAYGIQDEMSRLLGLEIAGWKVGAATTGIMRERNLDGPIPGPLYQPFLRHSPAEFPGEDFPRSNLEAEFTFRLLEDLPHRDRPYDADQLANPHFSPIVGNGVGAAREMRFSWSWGGSASRLGRRGS